MTYDPNDGTRRVADEDYRSTTGPGAYSRAPSNTGVIGAIIGVLAVVAIVFFVWRGYENSDTNMNTSSTTNRGAATSTTAPATPAPATTAPVAPATPAPAPAKPSTQP